MRDARCPNLNHGRRDAPVRACPGCGGIVNTQIPAKKCNEAEHGQRRRSGDPFCVDCAASLRAR